MIISLRNIFGKWRYWLLLWAASICYGQVYVGVHYPLDVICGSILGILAGYFTGNLFNRRIGVLTLDASS